MVGLPLARVGGGAVPSAEELRPSYHKRPCGHGSRPINNSCNQKAIERGFVPDYGEVLSESLHYKPYGNQRRSVAHKV